MWVQAEWWSRNNVKYQLKKINIRVYSGLRAALEWIFRCRLIFYPEGSEIEGVGSSDGAKSGGVLADNCPTIIKFANWIITETK